MIKLRFLLALLLLCGVAKGYQAAAQEVTPTLDIEAKKDAFYYETNGLAVITNGVTIKYTDASGLTVLIADYAAINQTTGDILAQGSVRIQHDIATWSGDRAQYNFKTKEMNSGSFRMGEPSLFISGESIRGIGEGTNGMYRGTNAIITTDDYFRPLHKVRARHFTIVPGKYVEASDATLMVGDVPTLYLPYFRYSLTKTPNHFEFLPGYRSTFGPYLLSAYDWVYNDQLSGAVHLDYRNARGLGMGPDLNYKISPQWGDADFKYYYTRDHAAGTDPLTGLALPANRQRTYFSDLANPVTNLTILSQVAYQSDPYVVRDFFESQYERNIQPNTFIDADKMWRNWSLDAIAQPRVNPFWETVERLPEVQLTGFRQQIGNTPFYYESQTSIGYYRRLFSDTNNLSTGDFSGSRADTFHQITLPETFFGWLTFTPRVGGRFTYYDSTSGPGATTTNQYRGVFNTGAELSFTASRVWAGEKNNFWDVDGIRHIFQPSINYVYVPQPNVLPNQLPQFDYELTNSLRQLPIEYPDYNAIDSINSQNTIRYGINNRIQTKRKGEIEDLVNLSVYMDWNLRPRSDQSTFSDIYSDLTLKPRSWLAVNSFTRYSIAQGQFNLAQHSLIIQPNNTWNWSLGHIYLRSGTIFGQGDNLFSSVFFYRLNENWGMRTAHYFDASTHRLQEQDYSIYRDLRSFTAALTFRALNNIGQSADYGVAFTFSFKSFPRFTVGQDTVRSSSLLGN